MWEFNMLYLIEPDTYAEYREDLDNMYRFRHKVFFDKLNWDVNSQDGMEKDQYDEKETYYLIYKDEKGIIRGCIRFIEMVNECMFDGPFKDTLPNVHEFRRSGYWEATRLAIDTNLNKYYDSIAQRKVIKLLLAGTIEFGLYFKKVECYIAFSYPSIQKLARKYGFILYDIASSYAHENEIIFWAFTPMNYSFDKLVKGMPHRIGSNLICNLNTKKFNNSYCENDNIY